MITAQPYKSDVPETKRRISVPPLGGVHVLPAILGGSVWCASRTLVPFKTQKLCVTSLFLT